MQGHSIAFVCSHRSPWRSGPSRGRNRGLSWCARGRRARWGSSRIGLTLACSPFRCLNPPSFLPRCLSSASPPVPLQVPQDLQEVIPAGAGWGWEVPEGKLAVLSPLRQAVRTPQQGRLSWLANAGTSQALSPVAGIGHATGAGAERELATDGGSGIPGARREPGEPCELPNKVLHSLRGFPRGSMCMAFSPRGDFVAVAGGDAPEALVRVVEVRTGVVAATLAGHKGIVYTVEWSACGRRVATASGDMTAKIWKVWAKREGGGRSRADSNRDSIVLQHPAFVYCARFAPGVEGSRVLVTGDFTGSLRTWDVDSGAQVTSSRV